MGKQHSSAETSPATSSLHEMSPAPLADAGLLPGGTQVKETETFHFCQKHPGNTERAVPPLPVNVKDAERREPAGRVRHRPRGHDGDRGQAALPPRHRAVPVGRARRAVQQPHGVRAEVPGGARPAARAAVSDGIAGRQEHPEQVQGRRGEAASYTRGAGLCLRL